MPRHFIYIIIAAFICITPNYVFAQASVPGSAEGGRVQERLDKLTPQREQVQPDITVPKSQERAAPSGAEKITFVLSGVQVDNMTVYEAGDIADVYQDMMGQKISLADVYTIAQRLTAKYRNDGYILTQIVVPPQKIKGGIVRLQAVEGFIEGFEIQGSPRGGLKKIEDYAAKIIQKKPLNIRTLERYLLLINDLPGISARSVLAPAPNTPGAAVMQLIVEQDRYEAFLSADNRGSRFLGPLQIAFANRFHSAFGLHESIGFQYVTAPDGMPERELDYIAFNVNRTINSEGTDFGILGSYTLTKPGFTLGMFDVEGRTENLSVVLDHPFIRSRRQNLNAGLQFDMTDVERLDNISAAQTKDWLRVVRANGTYQFADRFVGVNTLDLELSRGLDIFGASDKNDSNLTRARGNAEFTKIKGEITRLQRISPNWELYAGVAGQKSANNLLASEEFGIGGVNYGRAYDSSEITGEDGVAAKAEIRWTDPHQNDFIDGLQFFGFYDIGKVWDRDNTVAKERQRSVASAGVGVRVQLNDTVSGSAELDFPITRNVQTRADKDPRAFFSVLSRF